MKKILLIFICLSPGALIAQSKTTNDLQKRFDGSFSLFYYKNTLRMLNQTDNKEFDEMIKNIERMKFLRIDKVNGNFEATDYQKLKSSYASETYEEIMTSRFEGRNFDIYLKDKKGSPLGTIVLVNDSTRLYVMDILGTIDVKEASKLFSTLDGNSEIAQKMKSFINKDDKQGDHKHLKVD